MSSFPVSFRLTADEHKMLSELTARPNSSIGCNPSEFFRSLLWREWTRCKQGKSHVPTSVFSEMRNGRPKKKV